MDRDNRRAKPLTKVITALSLFLQNLDVTTLGMIRRSIEASIAAAEALLSAGLKSLIYGNPLPAPLSSSLDFPLPPILLGIPIIGLSHLRHPNQLE